MFSCPSHCLYVCSIVLFSTLCPRFSFFFLFNDTATTEIYTLSLHDALPIFHGGSERTQFFVSGLNQHDNGVMYGDRKSTRLNSSHGYISYAVFCLKKKKKKTKVSSTTIDTEQKQIAAAMMSQTPQPTCLVST